MLGAIIGDIAGSKYEFNNVRTEEFELMGTGCDYTDDTVCTVAVAEAAMTDQDYANYTGTHFENSDRDDDFDQVDIPDDADEPDDMDPDDADGPDDMDSDDVDEEDDFDSGDANELEADNWLVLIAVTNCFKSSGFHNTLPRLKKQPRVPPKVWKKHNG